ncbi:MAG: hypothetical protein F6K55_09825 [Moorea sp. SIO4A3]|nr:hypothetical protein [Moorena sp. SIO4A3]
MTYRDRLSPWCIIKPLPKMQRIIVARFPRRTDAEAHLQVLRRLMPDMKYILVFHRDPEQEEINTLSPRVTL